MRGDDGGVRVVRRMLYGAEFVDCAITRDDDQTAGMLTRRTFDAGAALDKVIYVVLVRLDIVVFYVVLDVSVSSLVSYSRYSTRKSGCNRNQLVQVFWQKLYSDNKFFTNGSSRSHHGCFYADFL